jgi:predicted P-loop ATPase
MIEIDDEKTPINDHHFNDLYDELNLTFQLNVKTEVVRQAMKGLCRQVQYHPVREYLDGLRWDEQSRIDSWLAVAFGANSNNELIAEYISMVGRLTLLAAVRRIKRPGTKFDTTPVLRAPQGLGRSKALRILAVKNEWFADQLILSLDPKQQIEQLDGKWIYELSELEGMKGAENSKVKSFMSRQFDNARAVYGHFAEERGRQNVFIGTVNEWHFLKDPTGNRRWWPIETTRVDLDWLRANVHQLWAEAVAIEKGLPLTDEALELPPHLWPVAKAIQDSHMVVDPWLELLRAAISPNAKAQRMHSAAMIRDYIGQNPAVLYDPYNRLKRNIEQLGVPVIGPKKVRVNGKLASGYVFFPSADETLDDDDPGDAGDPGDPAF